MLISGQSIATWLTDNVVIVMAILAGISILVGALNHKVRDAFLTFGLCLLGMFVITIASNFQQIGQWVQGVLS